MKSIKDILKNFNPTEDKYVSCEFQTYGVYLAEKLGNTNNKALYIRLAKTIHRSILDKALSFTIDANARNKSALFMWKLKELGAFEKPMGKMSKSKKKRKKKEKPLTLFD
jgi:hypothetical protein